VVILCTSGIIVALSLGKNIKRITGLLGRIAMMEFDEESRRLFKSRISELNQMGKEAHRMTKALLLFNRYVPTTVVRWMLKSNASGYTQTNATVLFLDVANFTSSMELMGSMLIDVLQIMFDEFSKILIKNGAIIDKYIGDAIMAEWNVPEKCVGHAQLACKAAVQITEKLKELNVRFQAEYNVTMTIRIGINTGPVFSGNIGSRQRHNFTVLGDTVNLAARLEALGKDLGTTVTVAKPMVEWAKDTFTFRCLGPVPVKGVSGMVIVYELMGANEKLDPATNQLVNDYSVISQALHDDKDCQDELHHWFESHPDDQPPQNAAAMRKAFLAAHADSAKPWAFDGATVVKMPP
jgi:adenylate cyclase